MDSQRAGRRESPRWKKTARVKEDGRGGHDRPSPPARRRRAPSGRDLILGKGPRRTAKPRTARYRALDGTKRSTCAGDGREGAARRCVRPALILSSRTPSSTQRVWRRRHRCQWRFHDSGDCRDAAARRRLPPPTRPPTLACEWWGPPAPGSVAACRARGQVWRVRVVRRGGGWRTRRRTCRRRTTTVAATAPPPPPPPPPPRAQAARRQRAAAPATISP